MITREQIRAAKQDDVSQIYRLINETRDSRELLFLLENLGQLPAGFNGYIFAPLLTHESHQIRYWAVKNMGKSANPLLVPHLSKVARTDSDSTVRREAISSIGRMRLSEAIPTLISHLDDNDPKVLLQVIRGLLVFREYEEVRTALKKLENHANEMIQSIIQREFAQKQQGRTSTQSHTASPDFMKNVVVLGDVRDVLACVPDESIHLTFTSPPYYNARDYSIYESYSAYLDFLTDVFKATHRVTKEGRFLIVNTSPIIIPRMSRAHASKRYPIPFDLHARLVNNGWEFIDDLVWEKPETSVKNRNAGFLQHRKPLGYKPNAVTEYLMVYRKQTDKLIDWNMRQYPPHIVEASRVTGDYETSNVWRIDPTFDRVHSAVFPLDLCHRIIRYYSFIDDLVFDPFGGSGTLGKAARNLQRYFFMTEKEPVYFDRMQNQLGTNSLFDARKAKFLPLAQFKVIAEGSPA